MNEASQSQVSKALVLVGMSVIEAIRAAGPQGAPSTVLYVALMTQGCTFPQYTQLMASLVRTGLVRHNHGSYFLAGDAIKV